MEENKLNEEVYVNNEIVSKDKLEELKNSKDKKLIQESPNHFRVLSRMYG